MFKDVCCIIWSDVVWIVDKNNCFGEFIVFVGYEWIVVFDGNNFYCVVIFEDG